MLRECLLLVVVMRCTGSLAQEPPSAAGGLVGLGEEAHGHASLNARKAAVLLELTAKEPVNAIIVESSFVGSVAARSLAGTTADRMRAFVYPFWLTDTVVHAFAHTEAAASTDQHSFLWGCDVQEDCRFHAATLRLIEHPTLQPFTGALLRGDTILGRYIGPDPIGTPMTAADKACLQGIYASVITHLDDREQGNALLIRCLENRIQLCDLLALERVRERMALRDSLMAANVLWVREQLRPEARIVLWAADLHVQKATGRTPHWCGEYLGLALGERYHAISVSHGRVSAQRFDRCERVRGKVALPPGAMITPCP